MDKKYRLLNEDSIVVDFGAAPGGWMQVSSERVGPEGLVLGVDLKRIKPVAGNTLTLTGDVFDPKVQDEMLKILPRKADVVLSDLAPDVTGVWQIDHLRQMDMVSRVVDLMPYILCLGGSAVLKVFEGEATKSMFKRVTGIFDRVFISKPPASRGKSSEVYFVCLNYRPS
ncbi:MAG: SAM-dependent methyltransferase [Nitrososphaerales archaeon]